VSLAKHPGALVGQAKSRDAFGQSDEESPADVNQWAYVALTDPGREAVVSSNARGLNSAPSRRVGSIVPTPVTLGGHPARVIVVLLPESAADGKRGDTSPGAVTVVEVPS
jgi:hypothetical protein